MYAPVTSLFAMTKLRNDVNGNWHIALRIKLTRTKRRIYRRMDLCDLDAQAGFERYPLKLMAFSKSERMASILAYSLLIHVRIQFQPHLAPQLIHAVAQLTQDFFSAHAELCHLRIKRVEAVIAITFAPLKHGSLRRVAFRRCVGLRAFRFKSNMHGIKGDRSVLDVCLTGSFTSDLAGDCTINANDPFRGDNLPRNSCMGGIRGRDVACRRREAALSHSSSRGVLATAKCAIAENRCSATWLGSATQFWRKRLFASWKGRSSRRLAEAASAAANRYGLTEFSHTSLPVADVLRPELVEANSESTAGSVDQRILDQLDVTIVHIQQQVRLVIRSLGSDDRVVPLHAQEKEGPEKGLACSVGIRLQLQCLFRPWLRKRAHGLAALLEVLAKESSIFGEEDGVRLPPLLGLEDLE
ncbi:hypothetical protein PG985_001945 [Apiospora marii]|uniref:uncharacterized protein n=1 Tax=Apiospora marii TaxID=335849 RepID=UPI003130E312